MVRRSPTCLAALPQKVADAVRFLRDAVAEGNAGEIESGVKRHLAPAVAHFSVRLVITTPVGCLQAQRVNL